GQLVAGVAHEINNPVSFIYGNLRPATSYIQDLLHLIDLYQDQYPTPNSAIQTHLEAIDFDFLKADLPQLLTSMKLGADRIKNIVLSLRTFSRMDEAEVKAVDIHAGIDSTLVILEHRLKANHNRPAIQVIKTYGTFPLVECYAGPLNQVFMNILVNAIDALDEAVLSGAIHHPTIWIQTEIIASRAVIRISDNGPGIPASIQPRLFNPFFTTKPVGKGTGMGLSISYQIVTERHRGTMRCCSCPEHGAEFIVELPLTMAR
ncbi:HAMP domain-containing histidine kinase, partial [Leptolyngbya sp. FACHB-36]|uniref:sensor histidine kinase n=1 Tax=Leptolyngbya sp. FACHB-36 TaxID=2692808 RepID=UPI0016809D99